MPPRTQKCPYCLRVKPEKPISNCYFCKKDIGDEYIVLIDEDGDKYGLCSMTCMESMFQAMEVEEFEEDE